MSSSDHIDRVVQSEAQPIRARGLLYHLVHNPKLIYTSSFLALCFWTFGYDGAVLGGVFAMPSFNAHLEPKTKLLTSNDISLLAAVPNTSIVVGLPLSVILASRIGRRYTLIVTCIISAVGATIQTIGVNIACVVVGRWIASAAIFMFIVNASTFLAEIAPQEIRGILIGLSIVLIDAAAVLAAGLNWAFSAKTGNKTWRIPFSLQIVFPVLVAAGLIFVQDSPTSYLIKSKDEAAMKSLRSIRRGYSEIEIQAEFAALQNQNALRAETTKVSTWDLFKGTNRRRTLLALAIPNFQQLSGIAFATTYATVYLKSADPTSNPFALTLGLTVLAFGGAIAGLFLVDYVGRRTLALTTFMVQYVLPFIVQKDGANLGPKTYLIFAGWMFFVIVITFFYYPETSHRSAAEVDEMFEAKVPARKFKSYICQTATENFQKEMTGDAAEMKNLATTHVEVVG